MRPTEFEQEQIMDGIEAQRARWEILVLVRQRHREQKHKMDHVQLWHYLRSIGIMLGEYEVKTFLQDLQMANLLSFQIEEEPKFLRTTFTQIAITARGVGVVERRIKDDLVLG